jgi:mannose-1-phosphate guanylyltransferase
MKFDAVLLAAGYGKRLRPLTNFLPKCLVPINGCPLIDYWIYSLIHAGVENILINVHYKHELVRSYLGMNPWRSKITIAYEDELLGTAGTLVRNIDFYESEICLVAHADNFTDFNVKEFIKHHLSHNNKSPITMMTFQTDNPEECGIVEKDADGIVVGFFEKINNPPSDYANAALYIFNKATIKSIDQLINMVGDISNDVIPHYLGLISTWDNDLYHRDIGSISSYIAAQKYNNTFIDKDSNFRWNHFLSKQAVTDRTEILKIIESYK